MQQIGARMHRPAVWKIVVSLLVAALVPALILAIAYPLSGYRDLLSIGQSLLVALPFALGGCLVFGLPTYLLLSRRGLTSWGVWLAASAVVGGVFALVIGYPNSLDMENLLRTAVLAIIAATVFRGMLVLLK